MEPRDDRMREDKTETPKAHEEPKPRRFRLVRLEERVAPQAGSGTHAGTIYCSGMWLCN
jgi:hypothetical protein